MNDNQRRGKELRDDLTVMEGMAFKRVKVSLFSFLPGVEPLKQTIINESPSPEFPSKLFVGAAIYKNSWERTSRPQNCKACHIDQCAHIATFLLFFTVIFLIISTFLPKGGRIHSRPRFVSKRLNIEV